MTAPHSEILKRKLRGLARDIRVSGVLRTLSWLGIVVVTLFALAFAAEYALGLTVPVLRAINVTLAAVVGIGLLTAFVRSVADSPSPTRLARLVESRFPILEERLLSLTTLTLDVPRSPVVDGLAHETEERTADLDFRHAFSWQPTRQLARIAGALVLVVGLAIALWPDASRFAHRLAFAWSPAVYGFVVHASPAGGYAPLGQPLILAAELIPCEPGRKLPDHCVALIRFDDGQPRRVPMDAIVPGRFAVAVAEMPAKLTFVIEAGERTTEPVDVVGALPVRLTGPAQIQIVPPPYVSLDALPVEEIAGSTSFFALQFSRLNYRFGFDRRPVKAQLFWKSGPDYREIPLPISDNGLIASAEIVAAQLGASSGELRLVGEHGIASTIPLVGGHVFADIAPVFSARPRINGKANLSDSMTVRPDEILRIEATLDDAVGLSAVELEWRVNAGPVRRELLETIDGKRRIEGAWIVLLRGKVKTGDRLELRVRGADNRSLVRGQIRNVEPDIIPAESLPPLDVVAPDGPNDWFSFDIQPTAAPLEKQVIVGERDDIAARLKDIRKAVAAEQTSLAKIARAGHLSPVWTPAQTRDLADIRKQNDRNQESLRGLGALAIARMARDIADRELARASSALAKSDSAEVTPAGREIHWNHADAELVAALKRIDELLDTNEIAAHERLKKWEAESLALQEEGLAKEIAQSPKDDPDELARWKRQQDAIAQAFEKWATAQPKLKDLDKIQQKQKAEQLARQAERLAAMQREMADKLDRNLDERLKAALADVAAKQAQLANDVARLERDLVLGLDSPKLNAPFEAAKNAGKQLAEGKVEPGLADQQKTMAGLEQLRDKLGSLVVGNDPQKLAGKLAEAQQKLIDDLEKLGEDFPRLTPEETLKRLQELHQRQKAVHQAIGQLPIPAKEKTAEGLRRDAEGAADAAAQGVRKKDLLPARDAMEKARDALRRLNKELPATSSATATQRELQQEKSRRSLQATAQALANEQKLLHDETRRILANIFKDNSKGDRDAFAQSVEQLKSDTMKLTQTMADDKPKAKEPAEALDDASRALQSAKENRGAGNLELADKDEQKAGMKLQEAGQKLDKLAAGMPMSSTRQSDLSQAFQDAQALLAKSSASERPSPDEMNRAAQAMRKTAQLAGNQMPANSPGAGNANPGTPADTPLPMAADAAWGDLPGEVRTRLTQDWRARYGEQYEEIIQRYFRNLAQTPRKK